MISAAQTLYQLSQGHGNAVDFGRPSFSHNCNAQRRSESWKIFDDNRVFSMCVHLAIFNGFDNSCVTD
jgi:hypothetical protein